MDNEFYCFDDLNALNVPGESVRTDSDYIQNNTSNFDQGSIFTEDDFFIGDDDFKEFVAKEYCQKSNIKDSDSAAAELDNLGIIYNHGEIINEFIPELSDLSPGEERDVVVGLNNMMKKRKNIDDIPNIGANKKICESQILQNEIESIGVMREISFIWKKNTFNFWMQVQILKARCQILKINPNLIGCQNQDVMRELTIQLNSAFFNHEKNSSKSVDMKITPTFTHPLPPQMNLANASLLDTGEEYMTRISLQPFMISEILRIHGELFSEKNNIIQEDRKKKIRDETSYANIHLLCEEDRLNRNIFPSNRKTPSSFLIVDRKLKVTNVREGIKTDAKYENFIYYDFQTQKFMGTRLLEIKGNSGMEYNINLECIFKDNGEKVTGKPVAPRIKCYFMGYNHLSSVRKMKSSIKLHSLVIANLRDMIYVQNLGDGSVIGIPFVTFLTLNSNPEESLTRRQSCNDHNEPIFVQEISKIPTIPTETLAKNFYSLARSSLGEFHKNLFSFGDQFPVFDENRDGCLLDMETLSASQSTTLALEECNKESAMMNGVEALFSIMVNDERINPDVVFFDTNRDCYFGNKMLVISGGFQNKFKIDLGFINANGEGRKFVCYFEGRIIHADKMLSLYGMITKKCSSLIYMIDPITLNYFVIPFVKTLSRGKVTVSSVSYETLQMTRSSELPEYKVLLTDAWNDFSEFLSVKRSLSKIHEKLAQLPLDKEIVYSMNMEKALKTIMESINSGGKEKILSSHQKKHWMNSVQSFYSSPPQNSRQEFFECDDDEKDFENDFLSRFQVKVLDGTRLIPKAKFFRIKKRGWIAKGVSKTKFSNWFFSTSDVRNEDRVDTFLERGWEKDENDFFGEKSNQPLQFNGESGEKFMLSIKFKEENLAITGCFQGKKFTNRTAFNGEGNVSNENASHHSEINLNGILSSTTSEVILLSVNQSHFYMIPISLIINQK